MLPVIEVHGNVPGCQISYSNRKTDPIMPSFWRQCSSFAEANYSTRKFGVTVSTSSAKFAKRELGVFAKRQGKLCNSRL